MDNPFLGMNPYLEHPSLWSGIHHRLISAIANAIAPQILPKYIVAIEERVYDLSGDQSLLVGVPDVSIQTVKTTQADLPLTPVLTAPKSQPLEVMIPLLESVTEGYLEIRAVATGEVVTAIEVLSPKNKQSVAGRIQYETKRQNIFSSSTHFIEIDLLHYGTPMLLLNGNVESDYRILVSHSDTRPKASLYAFDVCDPIPVFPIPLLAGDAEPELDLHPLIDQIYIQGGYALRIDYRQPPTPTFSVAGLAWIDEVLRSQHSQGRG